MQWTTQLRYRAYEDWPTNQIKTIKQSIKTSQWRFGYHIQPTTGLLNDPNGFSFYNHQWHLFYQAFPFGPVHGLKSWVELTSKDLVHWHNHGPKLLPDSPQDKQGAYSGSAIPVGNRLFIMYTGNVRDSNWVRHPQQNGAWLDQDNHLTKLTSPLIPAPHEGYTEHFRDPQIIQHAGQYYALIGAQRADQTGHVLLYRADKVTGPWKYFTELKFTNQPLGYMVECPNLVFIQGHPVLIFCPQGIQQQTLKHDNIYPNAYVVGKDFDWETGAMIQPGPITNLDAGFDVYATQAFNAPDGRILAISWIGLPEIDYPSDQENWANCLSLVKELSIRNQQLIQQPVSETNTLQVSSTTPDKLGTQTKFEFTVPAEQQAQAIIQTTIAGTGIKLSIDTEHGELTVDRSQAGIPFATDFGQVRTCHLPAKKAITVTGFLDHSVFELYLNHGQQTLTGRFFGDTANFKLLTDSNIPVSAWQLATTNEN